MEKIKISKGFKTKLVYKPDLNLMRIPDTDTIGICTMDIPYIRPKLMVAKGERVKTGTPVFCDKRDKSIQYVSPGTGYVKDILFGKRRKLLEVIISLESQDEFINFDPVPISEIRNYPKEALINQLKQGGMWQCFRQFPAKDTADINHTPPMIIVSLNGNDIASPHPGVLIKNWPDLFEAGLKILERFSPKIVVSTRKSCLKELNKIEKHITHIIPDTFPAWDPSVVLYHLKKSSAENSSWCIAADHLIMMAKFLTSGIYPVEKIIAITEPGGKSQHIISRQGTPIDLLTNDLLASNISSAALITTGKFNGRITSTESHLGFFENTLNIIDDVNNEKMFGFIRPGIKAATVSKTFLSCLTNKAMEVDCSLHGEERACINCSYCENICPNDLMPNFIMKALYSDDIEEALLHGLLDCCRCGLCSYSCPSKIELTKILSDGMDSYYKDKA